jgi:hypothetical protein
LYLDELEAIRLADLEGLYHEQGAERMGVSRATFGRILEGARRKIAGVLVQGQALRIEFGKEEIEDKASTAEEDADVPLPPETGVEGTGRGRCGCGGRHRRGKQVEQEVFPDTARKEKDDVSRCPIEPLAQGATDSQNHTEEVSS